MTKLNDNNIMIIPRTSSESSEDLIALLRVWELKETESHLRKKLERRFKMEDMAPVNYQVVDDYIKETVPGLSKDAQEAFEIKIHKRLVEIVEPTDKTIDSLMHLELPAGVDIEVKM
mgnify:CR=1 FL=1